MEAVDEKIVYFLKSTEFFHKACNETFAQADKNKNNKIDVSEAVSCVGAIFEVLKKPLDDAGIKVVTPTKEDVEELFKKSDADGSKYLDKAEFEDFYFKVMRIAAAKSAVGAAQKYGLGVAAGIASVAIAKAMISNTPIVNIVSKPFMGLLKPLIVGPLLGVAAVYGLNKGDILLLEKRLFNKSS